MSVLDDALAGNPVDRPLRAPLFAALAAEVEAVDVQAFLADPGRRARIYADLWRSLRPDILVVDTGGEPSLVADLLRRVRAVVPEPTPLAVVVTGPATLAAGGEPLGTATQRVLAAARGAAAAGAGVIFVHERVDTPPAGYAKATTPLWGSLRFFRAVGVLKAPAGWTGVTGPFLPCLPTPPPDGVYGLAVTPGAAPGEHDGRCALVTHTEDLAGHVPVRDLRAAVERLGPE